MRNMALLDSLYPFLSRAGLLYTVRRFKYIDNEVITINYQGAFRRTLVKEIKTEADLADYVDHSGFSTTEFWWRMIVKLNSKGWQDLYLYKVEGLCLLTS